MKADYRDDETGGEKSKHYPPRSFSLQGRTDSAQPTSADQAETRHDLEEVVAEEPPSNSEPGKRSCKPDQQSDIRFPQSAIRKMGSCSLFCDRRVARRRPGPPDGLCYDECEARQQGIVEPE